MFTTICWDVYFRPFWFLNFSAMAVLSSIMPGVAVYFVCPLLGFYGGGFYKVGGVKVRLSCSEADDINALGF